MGAGTCIPYSSANDFKIVCHIVCQDSSPANDHEFSQGTRPTAFSGMAETTTTWVKEGWLRKIAGQPGGYRLGLQGVS
jgi:hypothetical protein